MKTRSFNVMVTLVTIIAMVFGSFYLLKVVCPKVIYTGCSLIVLHDNTDFYNEQSRKTDAMTSEQEKENQERNDNFYQSEDSIIRTYSNMNAFFKIVLLFLALFAYLLIPLMWIGQILRFVRVTTRRIRKSREGN